MPYFESDFIKDFKSELQKRTRGIDLDYIKYRSIRSTPDFVILGPNFTWAALEFKTSKDAHRQPNQEYHVNRMNEKGFARFVYPENAEEVLDELEELFAS